MINLAEIFLIAFSSYHNTSFSFYHVENCQYDVFEALKKLSISC